MSPIPKTSLFLTVIIGAIAVIGLSVSALSAAEPSKKSFTSISPAELAQLDNLHDQAQDLMVQHNFRGAINVYTEILLMEPDDDDAYTGMGQAFMVLGDFKRAQNAFENAIHINPDNEIAVFGLRKIADPDFSELPEVSP